MFMHQFLEAGEHSNPPSTERHAGKPSTSSVHISIVGVTVGGEDWSPGGSRTDWDRRSLRPGSAGGDRLPPRGAVQVYVKKSTIGLQQLLVSTMQLVTGFYKARGRYNNGNKELY